MWNIVYYVFGASCVGVIGFGILNYIDKDLADEIKYSVGWSAVKTYHKVNLECKNIKIWCNKNIADNKTSKSDCEDSDEELIETDDINKTEFLGYNLKDKTIYSSNEIENNSYIDETEFDLMFLKKNINEKNQYKRILNKSDIIECDNFEKVAKPFLQVEYCVDEDTVSIHKNLENFYINGNNILDYNFLTWYMKEFYDMDVNEKYILRIIDSEINMFNLKKGDYIKIKNTPERGYQITSE
tara:strand:+ start:1397 stop:2119 length:723 start_codon:yes stop_codon:yes gene_type:complete